MDEHRCRFSFHNVLPLLFETADTTLQKKAIDAVESMLPHMLRMSVGYDQLPDWPAIRETISEK